MALYHRLCAEIAPVVFSNIQHPIYVLRQSPLLLTQSQL